MRSIRIFVNRLLWRLGSRDVLSAYYVRRVPVVECGEPLVALDTLPGRLVLDPQQERVYLLRPSVATALRQAADLLPRGLQLLIVDAYRAPAEQRELWSAERRAVAEANPRATSDEIDRLTSLAVARPGGGGGGHQTGAAVDLTLADENGEPLWMGTAMGAMTEATRMRADVPAEVRRRRRLLADSLTCVGFVNYPAEWWHFSLGDQLWAAYGRHRCARFGPITVDETDAEGSSGFGRTR